MFLLVENFEVLGVISWPFGMMTLVLVINFINILIDKKDVMFYSFVALFAGLGALQYFGLFDVTSYTQLFFNQISLKSKT